MGVIALPNYGGARNALLTNGTIYTVKGFKLLPEQQPPHVFREFIFEGSLAAERALYDCMRFL